jgi:hypothetical protein
MTSYDYNWDTKMQEEPREEPKSTYSRKACLADFLDGETVSHKNQNNQHTYSQSDTVSKNQEEHGHRKRIKP